MQTPRRSIETAHSPLSLRHNVQWTLVANIVYALSQWGVIISIARLGGPDLLGRFALGLAITAPIFLLSDLNLRIVVATDIAVEHQLRDYLAVRTLSVPLALLATTVITFSMSLGPKTQLIVLVVALSKAIESFTSLSYGVFQRAERLDHMSRSMIMRGPGALLALTVLLLTTESLPLALAGYCAVWFVVLLRHDAIFALACTNTSGRLSKIKPVWNRNTLRKLVVLAIPLGLAAGLNSFIANVPRYVVASTLSTERLGVFASIAYLITILAVVTSTMASAVVPRLAKHHAAGQRSQFLQLVGRLIGAGLAIGAVGTLGAVVAGAPLLALVYGPQFSERGTLIAVMASGTAVTTFRLAGASLQAARRFRPYLLSLVPTCIIVILSAHFLTKRYGLVGAAWSLALGYGVGVGILCILLFQVVRQMSDSHQPEGHLETDQ